jgi:hypothetical protein
MVVTKKMKNAMNEIERNKYVEVSSKKENVNEGETRSPMRTPHMIHQC